MSAIRDYYNKLNENRGKFEVSEWGKTIWVGPLTYSQYQNIEAAEKIADSERGFAIIQFCAKNEVGEPAFNAQELQEMRVYSPSWIITRTANQIMDFQKQYKDTEEDEEGN